MSQSDIQSLLRATRACLDKACDGKAHLASLQERVCAILQPEVGIQKLTGHIPAHTTLLTSAISHMPERRFSALKSALMATKTQLRWRVDQGGFYDAGADVGDGYKNGNMHALLVGPEASLIKAEDMLIGFFLLAPRTLYRDHAHLAPELYIPLTGPSGWRFDLDAWQDHDAGDTIYNAPTQVHATRVYEVPFLSLFVWERDISSACRVVEADDWAEVEARLHGTAT